MDVRILSVSVYGQGRSVYTLYRMKSVCAMIKAEPMTIYNTRDEGGEADTWSRPFKWYAGWAREIVDLVPFSCCKSITGFVENWS